MSLACARFVVARRSLLVSLLVGASCGGELVPLGDPATPAGDGGAGGAAFRTTIQSDLDAIGCTAGICHGVASVPMTVMPAPATDEEWQANYDEVVARAGTPTASLLLMKPTGVGGHTVVLAPGSPYLVSWREWIEAGAPYQP